MEPWNVDYYFSPAIVFIFSVIFLSGSVTARANTKVRVGFPDFTSSSVLFEIARQLSYLTQEGLDVEIIRISCAVSVRALVAKSFDFSYARPAARCRGL